MLGKVGIDADILCFLHIFALIAVKHECIVAVEAIVMLAGIFGTFEAVLQVAMSDAAGNSRTGYRTKAVVEASVTVALETESAQTAVESAQREKSIRPFEVL